MISSKRMCGLACGHTLANIGDAAEFCDRCHLLIVAQPKTAKRNEPEDLGGCEIEQPAGWYCTRDFHHNGPCASKQLPAAPSVEATVSDDLSKAIEAVEMAIGNRAMGRPDKPLSPEDDATLKEYFSSFTFILDPVSQLGRLLIEAKAAPRFRDDTYDAVDRIDAALFSGDEFLSDRATRQHFRYYLARWEKQLRSFDEFDNAMDGE